MINNNVISMVTVLVVLGLSPVSAQEPMPGMESGSMQGMGHSKMKSGSMQRTGDEKSAATTRKMKPGMDTREAGGDMAQGQMQGGSAPANARSPDYSEGFDFGSVPRPVLADEHNFGSVLVDRLERVRTDGNTSTLYDLQAWYGRDYERAVLKAEGDIDNGKLVDASTELLWAHAIATYWDTQLGVRFDTGEDPRRTWLAFGVQGLAPYWFEVDATAYIGESGRTAVSFAADYDVLFTQKLILQSRIEANWHGKTDAARGLGDGLSDMSAGLRLRYEFKREIAPYVGVEWSRKLGETEDFARAAGQDPSEMSLVAGLRFWF